VVVAASFVVSPDWSRASWPSKSSLPAGPSPCAGAHEPPTRPCRAPPVAQPPQRPRRCSHPDMLEPLTSIGERAFQDTKGVVSGWMRRERLLNIPELEFVRLASAQQRSTFRCSLIQAYRQSRSFVGQNIIHICWILPSTMSKFATQYGAQTSCMTNPVRPLMSVVSMRLSDASRWIPAR
jgi:hypothetical protein